MPVTDPNAAFCLARIGKSAPGWDTLVISGTASTTAAASDLWAVWADLERWPLWSPLHRSVSWTGPARLAEGATFDQQLSLGFPVGTTTEHVTLAVVEPGQRAGWAGASNGIRSCHLWSFTPLPGGGTQVGNVEAFTGLPIALVRPLAARRWNPDFQGAVDGLIRQVTQTDGAAAN